MRPSSFVELMLHVNLPHLAFEIEDTYCADLFIGSICTSITLMIMSGYGCCRQRSCRLG